LVGDIIIIEVLLLRTAKNTVFWDVTPCSLDEISFEGFCCSGSLRMGATGSSKMLINVTRLHGTTS
jgi:hypothetical protein